MADHLIPLQFLSTSSRIVFTTAHKRATAARQAHSSAMQCQTKCTVHYGNSEPPEQQSMRLVSEWQTRTIVLASVHISYMLHITR